MPLPMEHSGSSLWTLAAPAKTPSAVDTLRRPIGGYDGILHCCLGLAGRQSSDGSRGDGFAQGAKHDAALRHRSGLTPG